MNISTAFDQNIEQIFKIAKNVNQNGHIKIWIMITCPPPLLPSPWCLQFRRGVITMRQISATEADRSQMGYQQVIIAALAWPDTVLAISYIPITSLPLSSVVIEFGGGLRA